MSLIRGQRRLDWLLPSWLEDANAYSQSIDEDMISVGYTIAVNLCLLALCILIFSFLRQSSPDIFCAKMFVAPERTPPKLSTKSLFGWMRDFYNLDDELLLTKGGYDQLFLIRFYRLCFRIIAFSCIYCITVLIPLNG